MASLRSLAGFRFLPFPFSQDHRVFVEPGDPPPPYSRCRRIVTKGFAVILDLICMLMVMDVYPLSFLRFCRRLAIRRIRDGVVFRACVEEKMQVAPNVSRTCGRLSRELLIRLSRVVEHR